ncbi:MAG: SsgA family sporulation/cell division regulator [Streptomyces sp.]|uniref:SsgA family sporulation/cell division regulator n=1 Tax=Streptomyces sp. TaxID=1931 RepID=UPI0025F75812|nr:SsgA family sporulation/cell division regulator [Streptomyces sp.]MBW8792420.1 SsgA family sporulation/cell division regulator [Streptomyces sp.]
MSGKVFDTDDGPECAHGAGRHRWDGHARRGDEPEPVTCRTVVALLEEGAALPVTTDLRYDSAEPYSVFMAFNAGSDPVVEWEFGRELLASGRRRLDGFGDVQVWPDEIRGHGLVYLSFRSGRETFVVAASAVVIDEFLTSTFDVVPLGQEGSFPGLESFAGKESFD